ncbi:GGDEF domain-containing protein [Micromonospora sp. RTGN7]|uniref:GGDEF domain-containing protein n=1 Tax=Micromonospora sp. RTGN7 TaxID=3016526 RepID=UPI0029FEDF3A|nr:GGDEF domain-containing protein [Micromonospora sp. RTGN7]
MNENPTNREAVEKLTIGQHISDNLGVHELMHRLPYSNADGTPMYALTLRPLGKGDPWVSRQPEGAEVLLASDDEVRDEVHAAVGQGALAARTLLDSDEVARLRADCDRYRHLALTDPLTGALNRHGLVEHWPTVNPRTSLGVIDLDRFKKVNDVHGHAAGDAVLRQVAQQLATHGTVARLGGDELAVITGPATLLVPVWQVVLPGGRTIRVSGSVGWARVSTDVWETVRRADVAMYRAKHGTWPGLPTRGRRRVRDAPPAAPLARAVATALLQPDLPLTTRDA